MRQPIVLAGEACPTSPVMTHSPVVQRGDEFGLGIAPIYPMIASSAGVAMPLRLDTVTMNSDGLYEIKIVWASSDDYEGPAVVRVGRLDGPGRARVLIYYDTAAARGDAVVFRVPAWPTEWPSGTQVSGPGCYAYQVDGVGFSELIFFRVVP